MGRKSLPKSGSKITRSGEKRPGENRFRPNRRTRSNDRYSYNHRKNENFRRCSKAENGLCKGFGWGKGTGVVSYSPTFGLNRAGFPGGGFL